MTDNKSLTRFFQANRIPPSKWKTCYQTLQFTFDLTQLPGVENPAADYLPQLETRPEERVHLKLNDSIPVYLIEIDIASKPPKREEDEPDYSCRLFIETNTHERWENDENSKLEYSFYSWREQDEYQPHHRRRWKYDEVPPYAETTSVVKAVMFVFLKHACVPNIYWQTKAHSLRLNWWHNWWKSHAKKFHTPQ